MTTVEFFGQPKVNELRCTITLRNTNKNIVGFDIAVQNAEALQINQGAQQIAQNSSNILHRNSSAVDVSVANVSLQCLPAIILNEVNGWVSGVGLARHAVWRHVLVQQPRYVGVLQLPQEPRLPHHQFERLPVDVHALDDARAVDGARLRSSSVGCAECGAKGSLRQL